jgi:hypothetical protein
MESANYVNTCYVTTLLKLRLNKLLLKTFSEKKPLPPLNQVIYQLFCMRMKQDILLQCSVSQTFAHVNKVSRSQVSKINNLYLRIYFRQLRIHTTSICNNEQHDLALIQLHVARFVRTARVPWLDILTAIRNKHITI